MKTPRSSKERSKEPSLSVSSSPPERIDIDRSAQSVSSALTLRVHEKYSQIQMVQFSMEYQMTLQTKVERLTRKQATLLSIVVVRRSLESGVDPLLYMVMEWLLNFITKSNREPTDLYDPYEQKAAMLLVLVLQSIRGTWMNLAEAEPLPTHVKLQIIDTNWIPSHHTMDSWLVSYDVEKFFQVRIVPLDLNNETRPDDTERYSGYTKGYGNGGHRSSTLKTPYNSELDGETTDREPPRVNFEDYEMYSKVLLAIESEKAKKRRGI